MDSIDIMNWFKEEGIEIAAYANLGFRQAEWSIAAERTSNGIKLRVEARGPNWVDTVHLLYSRWTSIVNGGVPEFRGPLIEQQKAEVEPEISF